MKLFRIVVDCAGCRDEHVVVVVVKLMGQILPKGDFFLRGALFE